MSVLFQSQGDDYYDPFGKQDGGNTGGGAPSGGSGSGNNGSGGYGSFGSGGGNNGNANGSGNGQGSGYQNGNGYGGFGNSYGNNGQNGSQRHGNFYGPDYFSGRSASGGGFGYGSAPQGAPQGRPPKSAGYGFSLASMICGIAALVLCNVYTMIPLGIAAIVFAIIGKKRDGVMSGFAVAGLILGIVAVAFGTFSLVTYIVYRDELRAYIEEILRQLEGSGETTIPDGGNGGSTTPGGGTQIFYLPRLF